MLLTVAIEEDRSPAKECRIAVADPRLVPCGHGYTGVPPGRDPPGCTMRPRQGGRPKVWRHGAATGPGQRIHRCKIGDWGSDDCHGATVACGSGRAVACIAP